MMALVWGWEKEYLEINFTRILDHGTCDIVLFFFGNVSILCGLCFVAGLAVSCCSTMV